MSAWAVKDATKSWDSVFDRAWAGEPQFVSRGGSQTVVVISLQTYETRQPRHHAVLDSLRSCPAGEGGLAALLDDTHDAEIPSCFERSGEFAEMRS